MATKKLFLRGASTSIPVGFSVTTLFFGFWPSLFRGHIHHALFIFFVELFAAVLLVMLATASAGGALVMFIVCIAVRLIFAATRNGTLEKWLKEKGWTCPDEDENVQ